MESPFAPNTVPVDSHNGCVNTVFFDVDTQLDFVAPAGSLYVPGAETIVPQLTALARFAAASGIPVISSVDAHAEDDPEFKQWPPHCVVGTQGQQKIAATLLTKPLTLSVERGALDLMRDQVSAAKQIIVEKQTLDVFSNPNLRGLLNLLKPERVVLYGVVTELCVECAAMGLLRLGYKVEIVTDAVKELNAEQGAQMLARFTSQGGVATTVPAVTASA